jgi:hypothetical protein
MMRNKHFFILILLTVGFNSCNRNEVRRNKISFNDSFETVQDALLKIIPLMEKIQEPIDVNKGYDYRDNKLFINNRAIDNVSLNTIQALSKLSNDEKKEFVNMTRYLNSNEINAGSYDNYLGLWLFEYRYLPEGASEDSRVIATLNKMDAMRNKSKIIFLDHNEKLYLLKFK